MNTIQLPQQKPNNLVSPDTIQGIVSVIAKYFHPEMIILFGSYAVGDPTPDSDLDLLLIMETDLPFHKRATKIQLLFVPMPCSVDFLVFTPQEVAQWKGTPNHILTAAFRTGRIVYERSDGQNGFRVAEKSTK